MRKALALVHEAPDFTVFLLKDFHPYMKDSRVTRLLRDLAAAGVPGTITGSTCGSKGVSPGISSAAIGLAASASSRAAMLTPSP
mgnify:CR=1 FL=1